MFMMTKPCFRTAGKRGLVKGSAAVARNGSDPVDGYIGQLLFKIFIHQVFVSVFRIVPAAGPAAEENLCSGPFEVKISAAGRAFFCNTHKMFCPL